MSRPAVRWEKRRAVLIAEGLVTERPGRYPTRRRVPRWRLMKVRRREDSRRKPREKDSMSEPRSEIKGRRSESRN